MLLMKILKKCQKSGCRICFVWVDPFFVGESEEGGLHAECQDDEKQSRIGI